MTNEKIECDKPMARSKGLKGSKKEKSLGRCRKNCKTCIAAIRITDTGIREHI